MKLVSFSLSTQCSLPSTAKLASTHLDNFSFHKHQKNSPPAIASEDSLRKLSLTSKIKKDQKLAVGRQFSDADLASAVAVASAAAGKSLHTQTHIYIM